MMWMFGGGASRQEEAEQKEDQQEQGQDADEELFQASMQIPGKFEEVLAALDEIDDATARRLLGWACLHLEAPDVINRIGSRCSDISAYSLAEMPALQIAAQGGHLPGVQELLSMGVDVNRTSGDEVISTALQAAVSEGHLDCVEALLEQPEIEVDIMSPRGHTALHTCVLYECPDGGSMDEEIVPAMVAALIARGADVNKEAASRRRDRFSTPFSNAVASNQIAVVRHMLRLGKKPPGLLVEALMDDLRNEKGFESMLELLEEAGWGRPRASQGSARGTPAAGLADIDVDELLQASSQRQRSSEGNPPRLEGYLLHTAARSGDVRMVAELLAAGMDPNCVDASGSTALHVAAKEGHEGVVDALLGAEGIAVDKRDGGKTTALHRAAVADEVGAVNALLRAGASVAEAKSPSGQSVLHAVARRPAGAVLEALLKAGALPAATGRKGYTPLHVACDNVKARGTVEALLRAGALPGHCWNDFLRSPLLMACRKGNLEAVRQLLPKLSLRQINMSCSAAAGAETPLVAAMRCRDHNREIAEIVEVLLERGADPGVRTQPASASALFTALLLKPKNGGIPGGIAASPTIGPRVVRALVAAGANVNEFSETLGMMPLHVACMEGACPEVIEALLDLGANARAPAVARCFLTAPHLATMAGDPRALRMLIERPGSGGVDAVVGTPQLEASYLFIAVQHGQTEVVRYLLEEGADMDLLPKEEDGRPCDESLIEIAAMFGYPDIMNLLIQAKMFKDKAEAEEEKKAKAVAKAEAEAEQLAG